MLMPGRRGESGRDEPLPANFNVQRAERWLPTTGRSPVVARWTLRQRLRRAERLLRSKGCRTTILSIWRPEYGAALDLLPHGLASYHIADEYTFAPVEQPISNRERALIQKVARVFVHSPALMEKKGGLNRNTVFVPNGVDFRAYVTARPEPADLQPIPHPRIGYVGRVKSQLNFRLLARLAERHPRWSFVLIGPRVNLRDAQSSADALFARPNVYLVGKKTVRELPAYTQHLDVCTMCYVMNDYTKFIYPLKLHEYLAAGRPVVATPIRSLHEFAGVIELATSEDDWSESLERSLSDEARSPARVLARQEVARGYDWNHLAGVVAREMCDVLGPTYLSRLPAEAPNTTAR
jgi:glycosyltransferase involved in cell wall biosynthesis